MWLGRIRWQAEMPAVLSGLFVVMKKYKEKYWGKNMKQEIQFTEGKIFQPLFRFALPVLLAMCLQSMYGAVDLLIVGQFGVAADVSAVATGSQNYSKTGICLSVFTKASPYSRQEPRKNAENQLSHCLARLTGEYLLSCHWSYRQQSGYPDVFCHVLPR